MIDREFLLLIEGFLARHDLSPTTFGLWAMDDSRFVFDLRKGRTCLGKTMSRVRCFIEDYEKKQEAKRSRNRHMPHEAAASAVASLAMTGSDK